MAGAQPEELQPWQVPDHGGGTLRFQTGGFTESGQILKAVDGSRYYYGNAGIYAIYLQTSVNQLVPAYHLGRFFQQTQTGMSHDCNLGAGAAEVVQRTNATKAVLSSFLDIYLGALACAGGPVAWTITGMNVFMMTGQVVRDYRKYENALVALLSSRKVIRDRLPILYRTVLASLFFSQLESKLIGKGKDWLSDAMPGPKIAGKLVGVLLGAMGEDSMDTCFKALKELLNEVLVKVAQHAMEKNQPLGGQQLVLTEDQISLLAEKHIMRIMQGVNVTVPLVRPQLHEAKEIVRETVRNWNLKTSFQQMADGLEALGK